MLSKGSWGYPDEYLQRWKDELTITDAYIGAQVVWCAEQSGMGVGFYSLTQSVEGLELDFFFATGPYGTGSGKCFVAVCDGTCSRDGSRVAVYRLGSACRGILHEARGTSRRHDAIQTRRSEHPAVAVAGVKGCST